MVDILEKSKGMVKIRCAYCQGKGKDPFGIPSYLSNCQVCKGKGTVWVFEPFVECSFCTGDGIYPGRRLTCTTCKGKGVVTVRQPAIPCVYCEGTGVHRGDQPLTCTVCGGAGKVTVIEPYEKCTYCDGTGVDPALVAYKLPCPVCKGKGVVTSVIKEGV